MTDNGDVSNGRKLTFNPIYFANEFGDPPVLHLNISFSLSLSNKYVDLKNL